MDDDSSSHGADASHYRGHAHFWERALARRQVIRAAAGATGGLVSAGLWLPAAAHATVTGADAPRPIPSGTTLPTERGNVLFHFQLPDSNHDPSTITDFVGVVGLANVDGTGRGSDNVSYTFDVDIRFMQGMYFGVDGRPHRGAFGFF